MEETLTNRMNIKLVNNLRIYLKCISKPSYMSHKIFDNNLVTILKSKLALKLNKPAYIVIYILELSKVFIMIVLKINMTTTHNNYLQTLIV